jgi:hypothetical protein
MRVCALFVVQRKHQGESSHASHDRRSGQRLHFLSPRLLFDSEGSVAAERIAHGTFGGRSLKSWNSCRPFLFSNREFRSRCEKSPRRRKPMQDACSKTARILHLLQVVHEKLSTFALHEARLELPATASWFSPPFRVSNIHF